MCRYHQYASFVFGGLLTSLVLSSAQAAEVNPDRIWKASVSMGVTLTDGNSETIQANGTAEVTAETERQELRSSIQGLYGRAQVTDDAGVETEEVNAHKIESMLKYRIKADRLFAYAEGTHLYDRISEIDHRVTVGPGVGAYLISSKPLKLSIEMGVAYLNERVGGVRDDYAVLRASERIDWTLSATAKAWQSFTYMPRADDSDDYLLNAEIGVEAMLNSYLSLRVVAQDKYDSTPAAGQEENDLTLTTALRVSL